MVSRFVAVRILPNHPRGEDGQLHVLRRFGREKRIQPLRQAFRTAHFCFQSLHIVLHTHEILESIALGDVGGVGEGIEIRLECPIAQARAEEASRCVP